MIKKLMSHAPVLAVLLFMFTAPLLSFDPFARFDSLGANDLNNKVFKDDGLLHTYSGAVTTSESTFEYALTVKGSFKSTNCTLKDVAIRGNFSDTTSPLIEFNKTSAENVTILHAPTVLVDSSTLNSLSVEAPIKNIAGERWPVIIYLKGNTSLKYSLKVGAGKAYVVLDKSVTDVQAMTKKLGSAQLITHEEAAQLIAAMNKVRAEFSRFIADCKLATTDEEIKELFGRKVDVNLVSIVQYPSNRFSHESFGLNTAMQIALGAKNEKVALKLIEQGFNTAPSVYYLGCSYMFDYLKTAQDQKFEQLGKLLEAQDKKK